MALIAAGSPEAVRIDQALSVWQQGDVALEEQWFVHSADVRSPLTREASLAAEPERPERGGGLWTRARRWVARVALEDPPPSETGPQEEGIATLQVKARGLVVVTQTCDVVRGCVARPFVEVSPLVEVAEVELHQIERHRRPAYGFVPGLRSRRLVADLDRTMTVEKSIVASWARTRGCTTDDELRAFAKALSRKRERFAFPDDFEELAKKLHSRITDKHEKQTDEGRALRALREIRVMAAPSWDDHERVSVLILFIRDESTPTFEGKNWADLLESWLKLIPPDGRFVEVEGQVITLDDLTARDYVESDRLDLDHLSSHGG